MNEPAVVVSAPQATEQAAAHPRVGIKIKRKDFKQNNFVGYLFVSPWIITFILFGLAPISISLWLAFTDYDVLSGGQFVGLANFERMFFDDLRYGKAVKATISYVLIAVPLRLAFALGVAILLNTKRRGVYFYRAAYYIPSILGGSVAVAVMWRHFFGREGLINAVIASLGLDPPSWYGNPSTALWTLIFLAIWQFGSPMLIFLAGLRQIPQELYESAAIDGANGWHKFLRVTVPLLTPIIFFNFIVQMIAGFKQFTQAFILTNGRGDPLDTTLLYSLYLYIKAFANYEMGYAAAMAWVMLIIVAILTLISFKLSSYWVFYETKEG
jgi:multiple sugar transport system permease protein